MYNGIEFATMKMTVANFRGLEVMMIGPKVIADLITLVRGSMGVFLAWLGYIHGSDSLPQAILVMMLCWTGDMLDGGIARMNKPPRHNWLGDNDLYIDVFVSLGLGAYLVGAGFVAWQFACVYLVIWGLLIWRFGPDHNLLMLVQAFIYGYFIWVALTVVPETGRWLLAWVVLATILNVRRFITRIVPEFVQGMKEVWQNRNTTGHP
jgi:hypothetical protein